jgi:hypothetical protein
MDTKIIKTTLKSGCNVGGLMKLLNEDSSSVYPSIAALKEKCVKINSYSKWV